MYSPNTSHTPRKRRTTKRRKEERARDNETAETTADQQNKVGIDRSRAVCSAHLYPHSPPPHRAPQPTISLQVYYVCTDPIRLSTDTLPRESCGLFSLHPQLAKLSVPLARLYSQSTTHPSASLARFDRTSLVCCCYRCDRCCCCFCLPWENRCRSENKLHQPSCTHSESRYPV